LPGASEFLIQSAHRPTLGSHNRDPAQTAPQFAAVAPLIAQVKPGLVPQPRGNKRA